MQKLFQHKRSILCLSINILTFSIFYSNLAVADNAVPFTWMAAFNDVGEDRMVAGSGASWADYDGDGDMDLFIAVPFGENNRLYENIGRGSFKKVTTGDIVNNGGTSSGSVWGDYDNDGRPDLFVSNQENGDNMLYHNEGNGRFTRVLHGNIVSNFGESYSAAWGDYDSDGFLDLYVANNFDQKNFLYHNDGDGTFTRITKGPHVEDVASSYSPTWVDYDGDGDIDLFVTNHDDKQPNALYKNNGKAGFSKVTNSILVQDKLMTSGATWGDYDNDGDLDVFLSNGGYSNSQEQINSFFINQGDGTFTKQTKGGLVNEADGALTAQWADYDNDGDLDLFVSVFREHNKLYRNDNGRLTKVTEGYMVDWSGYSSSSAFADFNLDGSLDLIITNWQGQSNWLFMNKGNENNWLSISLEGITSNRSAVGAKVYLHSNRDGKPVVQFREAMSLTGGRGQNASSLHFGLGKDEHLEKLVIQWPSGKETTIKGPTANRFLTVSEEGKITKQVAPSKDTHALPYSLFEVFAENDMAAFEKAARAMLADKTGKSILTGRLWLVYADHLSEKKGVKLQVLKLGRKLLPKSAEIAFELGDLSRKNNDMKQAKKHYEQALRLLPADKIVKSNKKRWIQQNASRFVD
jgi:hypothetical protein